MQAKNLSVVLQHSYATIEEICNHIWNSAMVVQKNHKWKREREREKKIFVHVVTKDNQGIKYMHTLVHILKIHIVKPL